MQTPTVSVIVPAYNAGKYLPAAIESVLAQTYGGWELILVDDGSTDSTPAICDNAVLADSRIQVVHKRNGGLSSARNAGIRVAGGEYLTFLDADDMLAPSFLEIMVGVAWREKEEIVASPLLHSGDEPDFGGIEDMEVQREDSVELVEKILYQTAAVECSVCGKLYNRKLWENTGFREGTGYEDLDVFYRIMLRVGKVGVVPQPLYCYRQHPDSYIHTFSRKRADVLDVTDRMLAWVGKNYPQLVPAAEDRRMSAHFNILSLLYRNRVRDNELEERCWRVIREQCVKSMLNGKVRFKNRLGALVALVGGRPLVRLLSIVS